MTRYDWTNEIVVELVGMKYRCMILGSAIQWVGSVYDEFKGISLDDLNGGFYVLIIRATKTSVDLSDD